MSCYTKLDGAKNPRSNPVFWFLQHSQPEMEGKVVCDWSVGEAGDPDEGLLVVEGSEVERGERQGCWGGEVSPSDVT